MEIEPINSQNITKNITNEEVAYGIFSIINKAFTFEDNNFTTIIVNNEFWCRGNDVGTILGYERPRDAIKTHVDEEDKSTLENLIKSTNKGSVYTYTSNKNDLKTTYINKVGLTTLLVKSKNPNKNAFINFCKENFGIKCEYISFLKKEQDCIGSLLKAFSHKKPKTQYVVGKYRIDLYFKEQKLAIECDEFNHKYRNKEYENTRENFIKKELNCKFIRFNPDDKNFCIFKLINKIMKEI